MSIRYKSDPEIAEYESTKCCTSFLHYSWKTVTCLFSHVTLVSMVVSYCVLGAFTFEALEVANEKKVKSGIYKIRENVTWHLWNYTQGIKAFDEENYTRGALLYLKHFENSLLDKMNKDGWDGEEDPDKVQWTRTGSLFYSIIVITTIGYGHIAPKTSWGKVVTIFYAILGIPLMLLCLSNIGDVMATSFRFLYWKVCCYTCQKKPKKRRTRGSIRSDKLSRSRQGSFRRYTRTPRLPELGPMSHSDTELRYLDDPFPSRRRSERFRKSDDPSRKISRTSTVSSPPVQQNHLEPPLRGYSLDRKRRAEEAPDLDPSLIDRTPILFNKYIVGTDGGFERMIPGKGITPRQTEFQKRSASVPRTRRFLEPPRYPSPDGSTDVEEDVDSLKDARRPRGRSPRPSPSPRMMTPIGYGLPGRYYDDDSDAYDAYEAGKARIRPVPIWLCVFLVVGYILAGAYLFMTWEGWEYLDAAYFCFITLTTIGFGDLVPAKEVSRDNSRATISIALCSLYLLFGISLLAMSFNLVQEEVIGKVKRIAKSLGIIKSTSDDEDDDDDD
ncbi:unnamed protein product [Phyllotreta striolata]|uniref:Potassium channel domain-containing protein n=1 Tax=Phyllotreta striolata TaxID=444603 RepID=A0A9N9TRW1_PHYSR|nr:unnamed protein product [Phyllotreta striolata]